MPGLEMPMRGGGAAMLRELRDEERPEVEEQRLEGHLVAQEAEPQYDESYDSITNKQPDHKATNQPSKKPVNKTRNRISNITDKNYDKKENLSEIQTESKSVAQMIRQRSAKQTEQEVLKTVTLKLSPSLDERIERYCFENKMKKQEFWAEAAALYFETVAEAAE